MMPIYGGGGIKIRRGPELIGNEAAEVIRLLKQALARAEQGRALPIQWYRQARALLDVLEESKP